MLKQIEAGTHSLDRIDEFPHGMRAVYADWFAQRFPVTRAGDEAPSASDAETYDRCCRPVLEIVAAAHGSLGRQDIASVLVDWDAKQILDAEASLGSLFTLDDAGIHPPHSTVMEWLGDGSEVSRHYLIDAEKGQTRLADYCVREFNRGVDRMSAYARTHISAHLGETERWEDLSRILEAGGLDVETVWFDQGYTKVGMTCLEGVLDYLKRSRRRTSFEAALAVQLARLYSRSAK